MKKVLISIVALAIALIIGFQAAHIVEAQAIDVGATQVTLPIRVQVAADGAGLSGMLIHVSTEEGAMSCAMSNEAGFPSKCVDLRTVQLQAEDTNGLWDAGSLATIGSITLSGTPGEQRTVWIHVQNADDDMGDSITASYAPVAVSITIP